MQQKMVLPTAKKVPETAMLSRKIQPGIETQRAPMGQP
jgi:hypothetical protein